MIDVLHGLAITPWASNRGHKPLIVLLAEFGHANPRINNGFIHQQFRTAHGTAVQILFRRWPKGLVQPLLRGWLVFLATHICLV